MCLCGHLQLLSFYPFSPLPMPERFGTFLLNSFSGWVNRVDWHEAFDCPAYIKCVVWVGGIVYGAWDWRKPWRWRSWRVAMRTRHVVVVTCEYWGSGAIRISCGQEMVKFRTFREERIMVVQVLQDFWQMGWWCWWLSLISDGRLWVLGPFLSSSAGTVLVIDSTNNKWTSCWN